MTHKNNKIEEYAEEFPNNVIYCLYCKGQIYSDEKYIKSGNGYKHVKCRSEELGIIDELLF